MYQYNQHDQILVNERVQQFRDQTTRFLSGTLSADAYRPLRLMNGLYLQKHAPMLRVAIPYGLLSSVQLHKLADISTTYDKGYGHLTTRQNLQFNWPTLESIPDILAELASVQMHSIQTSGACIRNTTSDHLAGIAVDEIEDPRPYCELIRQWSTLHPEFSFLPRKFKIAVTGATHDRAAISVHDIGIQIVKKDNITGFKIIVGGGLGRTPIIGKTIKSFLPKQSLYAYLEAILRIYNLNGRRDNKYKARIKILVKDFGIDKFRDLVEAEWQQTEKTSPLLTSASIASMQAHFALPYKNCTAKKPTNIISTSDDDFKAWLDSNTQIHKYDHLRIVTISVKAPNTAPGDLTDKQMHGIADLAEQYSYGEIRVSHEQNMVFGHVNLTQLHSLWTALKKLNLATPNIGKLTDVISCPGLDFCSLANTTTLSIVDQINKQFSNQQLINDIGDIKVKISGCMNACGHHHVGNIGILGVDKKGEEWYQITIGGAVGFKTALGKIIGPAVAKSDVAATIDKILQTYLLQRHVAETFSETVCRLGIAPFKEAVYV